MHAILPKVKPSGSSLNRTGCIWPPGNARDLARTGLPTQTSRFTPYIPTESPFAALIGCARTK